ncbi:MAG: hypothetical protein ABS951_09870 [Solibacillus sp.]
MKRKFIIYIVGTLIISLAFVFFYLQESKTEGENHILTKEEQAELAEFNDSLMKEGGLLSSVSEELRKAGYRYQIAGMVYSMDDIRIFVLVPDEEVITDKTQKEINNIYKDMVSKHNLNWEAFNIKVVHYNEMK